MRTTHKRVVVTTVVILFCICVASFAQRYRRRERQDPPRTSRELSASSEETVPDWTNSPGFDKDGFTFARICYTSDHSRVWRSGGWTTDDGVSDVNLSFRLQQVTSMRTDPNGRILRLTDPELFEYPWVYMVEPGAMALHDEEVPIVRRYLLNGGFLMLDDFWGQDSWDNVESEMKKVFPDKSFVELSLDHPMYQCVFPIDTKGQVPNMGTGDRSQYTGVTWEGGADTREVHHRVIFDDKGRIMVIATHNTDNGDGWERESFSPYYFKNFSEKIAYPLGINIIFYAMTH